MTIPEFIKEKNRVIHGVTRITFVRDRFIEDMEITSGTVEAIQRYVGFEKETFQKGEVYLNKDFCPYCHVFLPLERKLGCDGCPMYDGGDGCLEPRSTYYQVTSTIRTLPYATRVQLQKDLTALAKEFVEANKDKLKEPEDEEV